MSMKDWEKKVLAEPGAVERVEGIQRELITAAELARMTPNERAAAVNERIVTDLDSVPRDFRGPRHRHRQAARKRSANRRLITSAEITSSSAA